jgi:guanine deaminase
MMNEFMKAAFEESIIGIERNEGGPFGAVIVNAGKIISRTHNSVIKDNDPTQHAEMAAIRSASKALGRFDLSDCDIYSSCEPCPMCLSAIFWARIKNIYYGCSRSDARDIGFDDELIYEVLKGAKKMPQTSMIQIDRDSCIESFEKWKNKTDKVNY